MTGGTSGGTLPFGCVNWNGIVPDPKTGAPTYGGTWAAMILPYIEQQPVYDLFDFQIHNALGTRDGGEVVSAPD